MTTRAEPSPADTCPTKLTEGSKRSAHEEIDSIFLFPFWPHSAFTCKFLLPPFSQSSKLTAPSFTCSAAPLWFWDPAVGIKGFSTAGMGIAPDSRMMLRMSPGDLWSRQGLSFGSHLTRLSVSSVLSLSWGLCSHRDFAALSQPSKSRQQCRNLAAPQHCRTQACC